MKKFLLLHQFDLRNSDRTTQIEFCNALQQLGIDTTIIGYYTGTKPEFNHKGIDIKLRRLRGPKILNLLLFQLGQIVFLIKSICHGVDVVMTWHRTILFILPFAVLSKVGLIKTKFVLDIRSCPTDHTGMRKWIANFRYEFAIKLAKYFYTGITVITDGYKRDLIHKNKIDPEKISVWTSGANTETFNKDRVCKKVIEDIKLRHQLADKFVIIYHGVMSSFRGLDKMAESLALLKNNGHIKLLLVGEGPAISEVKQIAQKNKLERMIEITGFVDYELIPAYIAAADIGVLPFDDIDWWNRSSPLKLMEYLSMETPVILTDIKAHRDVIGNSESGFFIKNNDPEIIASALEHMMKQKSNYVQMGKCGREIVVDNYTWMQQAQKFVNFADNIN